MRRGTTPWLTMTMSLPPSKFVKLYITAKQLGKTVFERELKEMRKNEAAKQVSFQLTQEETLALHAKAAVCIQGRGELTDGNVVATGIIQTSASEILKDGVI